MGFFDFVCQNDKCLEWQGGQNDHEDNNYIVYIRVPLKNYERVFLKGSYDGYGHVEVGDLIFKDIQFHEVYNGNPVADDNMYFCDKIWCSKCFKLKFLLKNEIPSEELLYTEAEFLGNEESIELASAKFKHKYLRAIINK